MDKEADVVTVSQEPVVLKEFPIGYVFIQESSYFDNLSLAVVIDVNKFDEIIGHPKILKNTNNMRMNEGVSRFYHVQVLGSR